MARVLPFKAVRPQRNKVNLVTTRSVVTYPRRIINAKLEENPFTFLHIIMPEHFEKKKSKPNSDEKFRKVKQKFQDFLHRQILIQDTSPAYYLYRQTKGNDVFTGIIAAAHVDDYLNNVIKKHEKTLTKRVEIFERYLDICGFNAEPVLLTYEDQPQIENIISQYLSARPEYEFTTADTILHEMWIINLSEHIQQIQAQFEKLSDIYIADGHHRTESSARLALHRRQKKPNYTGAEPFNYFMAFFIPESNLRIYEFHRLVKDLNGLSEQELLTLLAENFQISPSETPVKPSQKHCFGMYINKHWYVLKYKKTVSSKSPAEKLDVKILSDKILAPVFGITDLQTDKRIDFLGGIYGIEKVMETVDSGKAKIGFTLHPISVEEIKAVSDANETMPPKSTWIEPKLRSGLTIYMIDK
jgi:uncharacterized protein (DUF1015 family)